MNVIVQGKLRRFVGADVGGTPITEIWLGDKKIWPDSELVARRIVVELPQRGTRDWQYWVHALDATSAKATQGNYMRFENTGLHYYINNSPDGTEAYKIDGNVLTVELDGVPRDLLGAYLQVEAKIASRVKTVYSDSIYGGASRTDASTLPMLPSTSFVYAQACARRGWDSTSYLTVTGRPGGDILLDAHVFKASRKWVDYRHSVTAAPESDTEWEAYSYIYNGGWMRNLRVQYPAFSRKFKLKIISVS